MFSVVIPAYNAAAYIHNAIGSVLSQTVTDLEILVIDDGSTDRTREVVGAIGDERIRYIYQPNGGVSAARNTGIRNARGEFIFFLDADDLWRPNHLKTISRLIGKYPSADVYITGHEIHLHDGQILKKSIPGVSVDLQSDNVYKHVWEYGYFIHTNSLACRKSAFDTVGLFEVGIKNGEDDDMWYRLFAYFSAGISSEITTAYIRENSRATMSRIFVEKWVFLERVEEIMASPAVSEEKKTYLRRLLEQRKISLARKYILDGNRQLAWKCMRQINYKLVKKKKYLETIAALMVPWRLTSYIVRKKDAKYFRG